MSKLLLLVIFIGGCVSPNLPQTSTNVPPTAAVVEAKPVETPPPNAIPPSPPLPVKPPPPIAPPLEEIKKLVRGSKCAAYSWKDRGTAPKAYTTGVALVFARGVCQMSRDDIKLVSAARKLPESQWDRTDVLSWYNSNFKKLGMTNDVAGVDTLRHVYTLLLGLGMMESSGQYCCGRDMSAGFSSADSAEAGLFQASWGASRTSNILLPLFETYKKSNTGCMLDIFKEKVQCKSGNAKNWGTGLGYEWQALTKTCPAFATEYAAVLLRTTGGTKGEFGPIRRKQVELRPECDSMLLEVQKSVQANTEVCSLL